MFAAPVCVALAEPIVVPGAAVTGGGGPDDVIPADWLLLWSID
jgi:hypothetical protein